MAEKAICEICDRTFKDAEGLAMHNSAKHLELVKKPKQPFPVKKIRNWVIVIVIIGLLIFGVYTLISNNKSDESTNTNIPKEAIHWHPILTIKINGEEQLIPANLGLTPSHHPIHTHDTSGTLHYENNNPSFKNMRLGYFFDTVWRKKFNSTCILEFCNNDLGNVRMFVNKEENFEFDNYIPKDKDDILIEFKETSK